MVINISVSWASLNCCNLTLNGMLVKYFPEQTQSKITNSPNPEPGKKLNYVKLQFANICEGTIWLKCDSLAESEKEKPIFSLPSF